MENEIMQIIVYAGNARSLAMQSIREAKQENSVEAKKKMKEAEQQLKEAHHFHAKILSLSSEEQNDLTLTLFMVHGEDHLMAAVTTIDLAKEFLGVHEQLEIIQNEIKRMKEGEK